MFISQEEADKRLSDPQNIFSPSAPSLPDLDEEVAEPEPPPLPGNIDPKKLESLNSEILNGLRTGTGKAKRLHPAVRVGVAETSLIVGSGIGSKLGDVASSTAGNYVNGGTNKHEPNQKQQYLLDRLAYTRAIISTRAARRLKSVLYLLDDSKLAAVDSAADLSRIGKDMAIIMEKMDEKKVAEGNSVHFHIHKPEPRDPKTYEMVKIGTEVLDVSPI